MSPETSTEPINPVLEAMDWQPPMPPTNLIFDDGEPWETNRHRVAMNVLIRSLQQHWADRTDFYIRTPTCRTSCGLVAGVGRSSRSPVSKEAIAPPIIP